MWIKKWVSDKYIKYKKIKFVRDVGWSFSAKIVFAICSILITVIVGNYAGASSLGIYVQVLTYYFLLTILCTFGVDSSILKHIAEIDDNRDKGKLLIAAMIIVVINTSFLIFLIFFLFSFLNITIVNNEITRGLMIVAPSFFFKSINNIYYSYFNGLRKVKLLSIIQIIEKLSITLLTVFSLFYGLDIYFVFKCIIANQIFIFILFTILIFKDLIIYFPGRFILKHLKFGYKSIVASAINQLTVQIDVLMLGYYLNNADVGIYSIASGMGLNILNFMLVFQQNFSPIVSKHLRNNEIEKLSEKILMLKKRLKIISIIITIVLVIAFPLYVNTLYHDTIYDGSIFVFYILLVGVVFRFNYTWAGSMLTMGGYLNDNLKCVIIMFFVNGLLNLILIPTFGVQGAAIATSISFISGILLLRYYIKKNINIEIL